MVTGILVVMEVMVCMLVVVKVGKVEVEKVLQALVVQVGKVEV